MNKIERLEELKESVGQLMYRKILTLNDIYELQQLIQEQIYQEIERGDE